MLLAVRIWRGIYVTRSSGMFGAFGCSCALSKLFCAGTEKYASDYLHYKTITYTIFMLAAVTHVAQDSGTPTLGECYAIQINIPAGYRLPCAA